jgi:hypothetical protein
MGYYKFELLLDNKVNKISEASSSPKFLVSMSSAFSFISRLEYKKWLDLHIMLTI